MTPGASNAALSAHHDDGSDPEPLPVEISVPNGAREAPPRLHDFSEAQAVLRCSRQTIYRLIDSDDLRLVKIRNKSLIAGLEALIARQLAG